MRSAILPAYVTSLETCCQEPDMSASLLPRHGMDAVIEMKTKRTTDDMEDMEMPTCVSCKACRCFFQAQCKGCNRTAARTAMDLSLVDCCTVGCKGHDSCSVQAKLAVGMDIKTLCLACPSYAGEEQSGSGMDGSGEDPQQVDTV